MDADDRARAHHALATMFPELPVATVTAVFDESYAAAQALGGEPLLGRAVDLAVARLATRVVSLDRPRPTGASFTDLDLREDAPSTNAR